MPELLRVYLDANILFSASLREEHKFLQFWRMRDLVPITSMYAIDETQRNCVSSVHAARLAHLLEQTHLVSDIPGAFLPRGIVLPAHYVITGDKHHFGKWMNTPIQTHLGMLLIQEPSPFLAEHKDRLR